MIIAVHKYDNPIETADVRRSFLFTARGTIDVSGALKRIHMPLTLRISCRE